MKPIVLVLPLLLGGCMAALPPAVIAIETTYIAIKGYTEIAQPIIVKACQAYNVIRVDINAKLANNTLLPNDWNRIAWLIEAGDAFCKNPPSSGDPIVMAIWLAQVGGMLIVDVEQALNKSKQFRIDPNLSLNGR